MNEFIVRTANIYFAVNAPHHSHTEIASEKRSPDFIEFKFAVKTRLICNNSSSINQLHLIDFEMKMWENVISNALNVNTMLHTMEFHGAQSVHWPHISWNFVSTVHTHTHTSMPHAGFGGTCGTVTDRPYAIPVWLRYTRALKLHEIWSCHER